MNKLLKKLKIDMVGIHYESIVLGSTTENKKYFITVDNLKKMLLTKSKFQVVPKRKRTWIEPIPEQENNEIKIWQNLAQTLGKF